MQLGQRDLQLLGMEPKGAWTALVNDASVFINQINPIRPAGVSLLRGVIEVINQRGKFDTKLAHAHACNLFALSHALWAGKDDSIANIALHLPDVAGVRFQNVQDVKLHTLTIFVVKLVECGNLPPKWRSSVTAEDQDYWFVVPQRCEANMCALVQSGKREVWRRIADVQMSSTGACPHGFKGRDQEDRRRHLHHESPKFRGRSMHCVIYGEEKRSIPHDQ